ncbi:MAG: hypothetical protein N3I35_00960 [Clostridia bacterium]|nr:hypothetical protein [Clostridia bacterium]
MWETIKTDPILKLLDSIKKDTFLKWTTVVFALILVAGLIYILIGGMLGFGNTYGMEVSAGYGIGLSELITLLLKFLLFIFILGTVIGSVMYIKQNYSKESINAVSTFKVEAKYMIRCKKCNTETTGEFKFCPFCGEKLKEECRFCCKELNTEWKCCPNCGTEKGAEA